MDKRIIYNRKTNTANIILDIEDVIILELYNLWNC